MSSCCICDARLAVCNAAMPCAQRASHAAARAKFFTGLGRHGQGTLFLSHALGLDPDAVTFGKSVASGTYPLSGVRLCDDNLSLDCRGACVMFAIGTLSQSPASCEGVFKY
eukprot:TRINITY_DN20501_c0_g2_i1.p3 TRINITY_DN20501_c0_g2~~TRINITY_DN20501_c0_g2_i1.p3  ORF type:complete len:111 (+),score=11.61 TRINITY_DN20501_c0_g2_i1:339-671(+)